MNIRKKIDVKRIKRNVERFRWDNYRRDYRSDQSDLVKLYWYCVISDILHFQLKQGEEVDIEQRSHLANRLYLSYLGCFFEAHNLYHNLSDKFNRFSAHYWNQQNGIWLAWKKRVNKIRREQFSLITHSVQENFKNSYAITADSKHIPHDVTAYDQWHDILAQKVSSLLKNHLRNGTLAKREPGTVNAVFPYHIKDDFIEVLDRYGCEYFKANIILSVINRIEKQFKNGKNIFSLQKQLGKDETIKDAINDLLNKHPELGELGYTQLANLIRLKYLNSNGDELKLDSIKTTLRRMDF